MKHTASEQEISFYANVGAWIEARRKAAKLSRRKFGARLGVHRNVVLRWEQGQTLSAWMYTQICEEFGKRLQPVSSEIHEEVLRRIA